MVQEEIDLAAAQVTVLFGEPEPFIQFLQIELQGKILYKFYFEFGPVVQEEN